MEYISVCENASTFHSHLCPCGKDPTTDERKLICVTDSCDVCKNSNQNLRVCEQEREFLNSEVYYKWLKPIKIGNRNETVLAYDVNEFCELLCTYYEEKYRLHNWVYKHQDVARRNCHNNLQPGHVILKFDYAAKAAQFHQDCMSCSASRRTSKFIVFAHFDPKLDEFGHNMSDTTTELFAFHSNCLTQDNQSVRRCLQHVCENLIQRGFLKNFAYFWSDGSGSQNKGRMSFRNPSDELSLLFIAIQILQNFACAHHFRGSWDTEGGRQTRAIKSHILNCRDTTSVLDAGDNVNVLSQIMNRAGRATRSTHSNTKVVETTTHRQRNHFSTDDDS